MIEAIVDEIIDGITTKANETLASVLGVSKLDNFQVGSLGNFPYLWKNANGRFSKKTYSWIRSSLKENECPVQLDGLFTNLYISAYNNLTYSLSTNDSEKLDKAMLNAKCQQVALIEEWENIYGKFASTVQSPIDEIVTTVCTKWSNKNPTLDELENTDDLKRILNTRPASSESILPLFSNWLGTMSERSLYDKRTTGNGYIKKVLEAVKYASEKNGGLYLDDNKYYPSYTITPSVVNIQNALNSDQSKVELAINIRHSNLNEFDVNVNGQTHYTLKLLSFLKININGDANYFQEKISDNSEYMDISMTFSGVNLVNFGPEAFDIASNMNWYWKDPLNDALKNGDRDLTGYKFSPRPQIDFSYTGPFAFLTGVAISNYPSIKIVIKTNNYNSIAKEINQSANFGLSFIGIPLGVSSDESSYYKTATTNAIDKTVTITFAPPKNVITGGENLAWVLGVQTEYPCAKTSITAS